MRTFGRGSKSARLTCEPLEDRLTPAVAYALSGTSLLSFDTATPLATTTTALVTTNLVTNEVLAGIDFRPQNGQLYALGIDAVANTGTLYTISTRTGVLTRVGAGSGIAFQDGSATPVAIDLPDPAMTGYGFDFNPTVDRIRVVAGVLNFRVDPNTGAGIDGDLGMAAGSVLNINTDGPINGATTNLSASAYTNNVQNATTTTLFGLDAVTNALFIQAPANAGTTTIVGTNLGVDFTAINGFDISSSGIVFAAFTVGGTTGLYTINTTTGVATSVANIGNGTTPIQGFAVASEAAGFPAVALNAAGTAILRFSTATPGTVTTAMLPAPGAMGGVNIGDVLVGLDYRPNTGQLFALAVNTTNNTLQLYRVSPQDGPAGGLVASVAAIGAPITNVLFPMGTTFPAGGYGVDFNPTAANGAGLIRVTTATGLNFRIQPNNGTVAGVDTPISALPMGSTGVSSTAYTNSFGQPAGLPTTQYTLDAASNSLFIQGATPPGPNGGVQSNQVPVTLNGAALDFTDVSGFDIPAGVQVATSGAVATGFGYAALTVGGVTNLYRIDLTTGAATLSGATLSGAGLSLGDATGGVVSVASAAITADEGGSATVTLTRTGGVGPQTVTVNVTGGNASAGSDFAAGPFTVVFTEGSTAATLTIPLTADMTTEGVETFVLTVSVPGGVAGAVASSTVTINDTSITPTPPPFFSAATVVGGSLVLQGAGVAGGMQVVPLPTGSSVIFSDLNGDGQGDLILFTPALVVVADGQSGRFLALASDVDADGIRDLLIFNLDGTTTTTNGRTGITVTA